MSGVYLPARLQLFAWQTFSKAHAVAAARSFLKETVLGILMKERDNKSRDYQVKNPANS
jgi:hypothetical protein